MLQRVNPLVLNMLPNINLRIHPSEQQKKGVSRTYETPSFLYGFLFFGINKTILGILPVFWLWRTSIFIQAGRAKTAVIYIFDLLQLIQRKIYLITPALA